MVPARLITPRTGNGSTMYNGLAGASRCRVPAHIARSAAGRGTANRDVREIEPVPHGARAEVVDRGTDVKIGARPTASRLTDAAIPDFPAGDAVLLELVTHRGEIPGGLGHPTAAVHQDDDRMRTRAGGQPQFANLIGVLPVGKGVIGWRHRQLPDDVGWPHRRRRRLLGLSRHNGATCENNRNHR